MNKSELRALISKRINAYQDDCKKSLSDLICRRIEEDQDFLNSDSVGLYIPMKDEVDVKPLINGYFHKKNIFLPYIDDSNVMGYAVFDGWNNIKKNKFGIKEPLYTNDFICSESLQLLVVPALAFDCNGYRLGRGGGYYDRFLKKNKIKTIGVSLYPYLEFETDSWDIPLDKVFNANIK